MTDIRIRMLMNQSDKKSTALTEKQIYSIVKDVIVGINNKKIMAKYTIGPQRLDKIMKVFDLKPVKKMSSDELREHQKKYKDILRNYHNQGSDNMSYNNVRGSHQAPEEEDPLDKILEESTRKLNERIEQLEKRKNRSVY